jgi:hypothetical protein
MFAATYVMYVKYDFIMADLEEKCITIKFSFKLKNNALKHIKCSIFGDTSIGISQTSEWFSPFEHK